MDMMKMHQDPEYRERLTGENNPFFGKTHTEETKAKISAALTGKNHPMYGKSHTEETRAKISAALTGKTFSKEHRAKLSAALTGKTLTEETKAKISAAQTGENNPFFGKTHTEEHKAKISAASTGKTHTEETKAKLSAALTGENAPNWKGGISFEPYCPMFNNKVKESIRNKWNRTCAFCGKPEFVNGKRLDVHHVDGDKMAGCNGKKWNLIALCRSCHGKLHNNERFECLSLMSLEVR